MSRTARRRVWAMFAALTVGTTFQVGLGTGCANYAAYQALGALDFCSLLNCEGSSFFNFCEPIAYLVDCPNQPQN